MKLKEFLPRHHHGEGVVIPSFIECRESGAFEGNTPPSYVFGRYEILNAIGSFIAYFPYGTILVCQESIEAEEMSS